jgi:kexin
VDSIPDATPSAFPSDASNDPQMTGQWYLFNSSIPGTDVNATNLWGLGIKGGCSKVAVVDDGVDTAHEDLKDNLRETSLNYNYSGQKSPPTDPSHYYSNSFHGTCVAGIIGARDNNSIGIRGVSPRAVLVGRNLLEGTVSDADQQDAMSRGKESIWISNNSWGATDGTGTFSSPSIPWQTGIEDGLSGGRNSKGIIFLWAAGNGSQVSITNTTEIDNSNYDSQANYYGVLAIGGVGKNGKKPYYAERGANLWVSGPTLGDDGNGILTTDRMGSSGRSSSNYYGSFNGTSAATPMVSGVVALLLDAFPNLNWRDVREILAKSARKIDSSDSNWFTNGAGLTFNEKYGFGLVDAQSALKLAKTWSSITGNQLVYTSSSTTSTTIPDNNTTGITQTIVVADSGISTIEYVEIYVSSNHTYFADINLTLKSPSNSLVNITKKHVCNTSTCSLPTTPYRFGASSFLGESANGIWTIKAVDASASDTGNISVYLKIRGR